MDWTALKQAVLAVLLIVSGIGLLTSIILLLIKYVSSEVGWVILFALFLTAAVMGIYLGKTGG